MKCAERLEGDDSAPFQRNFSKLFDCRLNWRRAQRISCSVPIPVMRGSHVTVTELNFRWKCIHTFMQQTLITNPERRVVWNRFNAEGPEYSLGCLAASNDKNTITLNGTALLAYPIHVVPMSFSFRHRSWILKVDSPCSVSCHSVYIATSE